MDKCYIYTRVSTAMQVDRFSLDAQKNVIQNYCKMHEIEIVGEYCDKGFSGKSIQGRPDFLRMLEDIKTADIQYIVVFKLSRFGRNTADTLTTVELLKEYGIELISIEDNLDTSSQNGRIMLSLLSTLAELERENILSQTMAGRKEKAMEGKWNGGFAPFGYTLEGKGKDSKLVVVEKEAEIIRIIFDKYVHEGRSATYIAKYLYENGYYNTQNRNRTNELISSDQVYRIIDSEVYAGKITYGKSKVVKVKGEKKYKRIKDDDYIIAEGEHEAIIEYELWEKAHERRIKEKGKYGTRYKSKDHRYILSNIIKCPVCQRGMSGNVSKHKRKSDGTYYEEKYYYRCKHYLKQSGHSCTYKTNIRADLIDLAVEELVGELVQNKKLEQLLKDKINAGFSMEEVEKSIDRYENELAKLEKQEKNLDRQMVLLDVDDPHYEKKYDKINNSYNQIYDEINKINIFLQEAEERKEQMIKSKVSTETIYKILSNFGTLYKQCTDDEKYELMHALVEEIQIFEEKQKTGQIIKSIKFKLPVIYKGEQCNEIFLTKEKTDETVWILLWKNYRIALPMEGQWRSR